MGILKVFVLTRQHKMFRLKSRCRGGKSLMCFPSHQQAGEKRSDKDTWHNLYMVLGIENSQFNQREKSLNFGHHPLMRYRPFLLPRVQLFLFIY
jgi:hypothetical protein